MCNERPRANAARTSSTQGASGANRLSCFATKQSEFPNFPAYATLSKAGQGQARHGQPLSALAPDDADYDDRRCAHSSKGCNATDGPSR